MSEFDRLAHGGGDVVPVISDGGVSEFFFAEDVVLSNEFRMDVLAPNQLGDNQDRPACLITFLGRDAKSKGVKAVTVVMEPEGWNALLKGLRAKYGQIPLEYR